MLAGYWSGVPAAGLRRYAPVPLDPRRTRWFPWTPALRRAGGKVAQAHLTHLNPFPRNLGQVLSSYEQVLVPEMNLGQLLKLVRAEFLVDAVGYNRVRGLPLRAAEIEDAIWGMLGR